MQYGLHHKSLELRRLVDRKMIDAGLAADIYIREFAMKAGAAVHIGESALRYVENARDVLPKARKAAATIMGDVAEGRNPADERIDAEFMPTSA